MMDIGDLANMVLQYSVVNTRCGEGMYKCKTLHTQCQVIEAYTSSPKTYLYHKWSAQVRKNGSETGFGFDD